MDQPRKRYRYRLNVPGDFYVEDGCCASCGVPAVKAPDLFDRLHAIGEGAQIDGPDMGYRCASCGEWHDARPTSFKIPVPDALNLPVHVHTNPVGEGPRLEVMAEARPLAIEQRESISRRRADELIHAALAGVRG